MTPQGGFLRNSWYAIAWSEEVKDGCLFPRRLLDEPILMFRDAHGVAIAIGDRCPHRFAPLHLGKLIDGCVECPYHGLRFDAAGVCTYNPHGNGLIPKGARVQRYPATERYGLVWIWMGDPAKANSSAIPDFAFLADTRRFATNAGNYLKVRANYQLVVDNLLDLSHLAYLHGAASGIVENAELGVFHEGTTVWSRRKSVFERPFEGVGSSSDIGRHFVNAGPLEHWMDMRWDPASALMLEIGWGKAGRPRSEALVTYATHLLSPETKLTTHYFFGTSRGYDLDNTGATERQRAWQYKAFTTEDEPMLAACQEMIGAHDFWELRPILLSSDVGAVRARKVLSQLIAAESASDGIEVELTTLKQ